MLSYKQDSQTPNLTIINENERSRRLIGQAQQALREDAIADDVLELIKTIVFYKERKPQ
jgi:hypothetical protein